MPTRDCGQCERLHCGNGLGDRDIANLVARLLCEVADNTAGGGGGGTGKLYSLLCDDNGSFLRIYDPSNPAIFVDLTLSGAPYVPVGTVTICSEAGVSVNPWQVLCDDNGGVLTEFIRVYDAVTPTLFTDFTVDGVAYVPTGVVGLCKPVQGVPVLIPVRAKVEAFYNLKYFTANNTTTLTTIMGDAVPGGGATVGQLGTVYPAIFTQAARALTMSIFQDQVYAICGTTFGTQTVEVVDLASSTNISTIVITGVTAGLVIEAAATSQNGTLWVLGVLGGVREFYTMNPFGGFAGLAGATTIAITGDTGGFDFMPDGRMIANYDSGIESRVVEVLPTTIDSGTTVIYVEGRTLFRLGDTGSGLRGPMAVTGRGTILSVSANPGEEAAEFDFAGNEVRQISVGGMDVGGSIAYFNPLGDLRLTVDTSLKKSTIVFGNGFTGDSRLFLEDGTDVSNGTFSFLDFHTLESFTDLYGDQNEASFVYATLAFGSVTTAFATLIESDPGKGCRVLQVANRLNRDIILSFSGAAAVDQVFVLAGGSVTLDFGASDMVATGRLSIKTLVADATSGDVHATIIRKNVKNKAPV